MKKTTKALLSTALVLFIAGALLALSSMLFIKFNDIDLFGVKSPNVNIQSKRVEIRDILGASPDSNYILGISQKKFNAIEASLFVGDISIDYTDESEPYIMFTDVNTENVEIYIAADTITIKEKDTVGYNGIYVDSDGISYKGIRQLFGPGTSAAYGQKIDVFVPKDYPMVKITAETVFGDIALDSVNTKDCEIKDTFGNISIKGASVDGGKLIVSATKGDISIKETYYSAASVKTKFGDISADISEAEVCNTTIESWFGNADVVMFYRQEDYRITFKTNLGNVTSCKVGYGMIFENDPGSNSRISVNLIGGNVTAESLGNAAPLPPEPETETGGE